MPARVKKTQLNRKDAKNAKIRKVKMEIEETAQVIVDSAIRLMKFGIEILVNNLLPFPLFAFPLRPWRLCGSTASPSCFLASVSTEPINNPLHPREDFRSVGSGPENTVTAAAPFEPLGGFQHIRRNVVGNLISPLLNQGAVAVAAPAEFQIRPDIESQTTQSLNQLIFQVQRAHQHRPGTPAGQLPISGQKPPSLGLGPGADLRIIRLNPGIITVKPEEPEPSAERSQHGVTEKPGLCHLPFISRVRPSIPCAGCRNHYGTSTFHPLPLLSLCGLCVFAREWSSCLLPLSYEGGEGYSSPMFWTAAHCHSSFSSRALS